MYASVLSNLGVFQTNYYSPFFVLKILAQKLHFEWAVARQTTYDIACNAITVCKRCERPKPQRLEQHTNELGHVREMFLINHYISIII